MPIVLFRVDERLIHGQVVVGWGERLHAEQLVVIDDTIVASPWEQELYCLGVPAEMEACFVSTEEARRLLPGWRADRARTIVLVRALETVRALAASGGLREQPVNLGGIHHAAGRERVLPYLFLGAGEHELLRELSAGGVQLSAQDLPGSREVPVTELLAHA